MKKHLLACTLSSIMLASSGVVMANETPQEFSLDSIVVTASRIEQTLLDAPAAVSIITQAQIQEKGAITLADALDGTPGVIISRYNGRSGTAKPYIAGTDMVVVLLDGVRLNTVQGSSNGGIDLNQFGIDPETIDRIEVIQGGNSALYGADAVGGVIQIFTKKGAKTPVNTFGIALGDDGQAQYKIGTSGSKGKYDWRFNGSYYDTDGYRPNSYGRDKDFSLHVGRQTNGGNLTFDYNYGYHKSGFPGYITSPSLTDYGYSNNHIINLGYQKDDFSLRYYYKNRDYRGIQFTKFDHEETTNGLIYQDSKKLSGSNMFTWGADLSVATVNTNVYSGEKNRWRRSFFVQDQMTFGKFILTPAVLHEMNNDFGNKTLPKISGVYKFDDKTSYFANWGKVFKAPSFNDLYWIEDWGGGMGMFGNPDLKPESGWTFETGLKRQFDENTNASITFFNRHIKDRIAWMDMGSGVWRVQNIDSYKAQGVTLAASKKFDKHWQLDTNYTYVDTDATSPTYSEPRNQFYFGIKYENKKYKHSLSLESLSANDQSIVTSTHIAGYATLNTSVQYKVAKDQRIFLNVNNILDKKYEQIKNYPANGINFMLGWDIKF